MNKKESNGERKVEEEKRDVFISALNATFYSEATKEISNCRNSLFEAGSHPGKRAKKTIKKEDSNTFCHFLFFERDLWLKKFK